MSGIFGNVSPINVEYAEFTIKPTFFYKDNRESLSLIKENIEELLNGYKDLEFDIIHTFNLEQSRYDLQKEAFNTKQCSYCKSPLRYIKRHDFWGCANYRSEGHHTSISGLNPTFYTAYERVPINWVSDIILKAGFKGKIKAKDLFNFYLENGFPDLREKYGFGGTGKKINQLIETKNRSQEQEFYAKEQLEYIGKVVSQQCITYRLVGKEKRFCIPDFIVGTKEFVKVVDAKLDYPDDDKMDLYIALVKFIMRSKNDVRPVTGAHIIYEDNPFKQSTQSRHEIIEIMDISNIH